MACYKKIFIILFIILVFFIIHNNKCFASTYDFYSGSYAEPNYKLIHSTEYRTIKLYNQDKTINLKVNVYINLNSNYVNFLEDYPCIISYNTTAPVISPFRVIFPYVSTSNFYYEDNNTTSLNITGSSSSNRRYKTFNNLPTIDETQFSNNENVIFNVYFNDVTNYYAPVSLDLSNIIYSSVDIYQTSNNIFNDNTVIFKAPYNVSKPIFFIATQDLQALNFDNLIIYSNDWDYMEQPYYFHILQYNYTLPDTTITYYNDRVWKLDNLSKYWQGNKFFSIPIDDLQLKNNTTYYFVLTSESSLSSALPKPIMEITSDTIFDVVQIDTTDKISLQDTNQQINDNLNNMQQQNQEFQNNILDTNISNDTNNDIDSSLDYNNNNQDITNINNGFFTRLTSLVSNLADYNLNEIETVSFPIPNTNQNLVLYSNTISANIPVALLVIIQGFWWFIFSMYLYKFINKIYISISSGNVLSGFTNNDEVITNNML